MLKPNSQSNQGVPAEVAAVLPNFEAQLAAALRQSNLYLLLYAIGPVLAYFVAQGAFSLFSQATGITSPAPVAIASLLFWLATLACWYALVRTLVVYTKKAVVARLLLQTLENAENPAVHEWLQCQMWHLWRMGGVLIDVSREGGLSSVSLPFSGMPATLAASTAVGSIYLAIAAFGNAAPFTASRGLALVVAAFALTAALRRVLRVNLTRPDTVTNCSVLARSLRAEGQQEALALRCPNALRLPKYLTHHSSQFMLGSLSALAVAVAFVLLTVARTAVDDAGVASQIVQILQNKALTPEAKVARLNKVDGAYPRLTVSSKGDGVIWVETEDPLFDSHTLDTCAPLPPVKYGTAFLCTSDSSKAATRRIAAAVAAAGPSVVSLLKQQEPSPSS